MQLLKQAGATPEGSSGHRSGNDNLRNEEIAIIKIVAG